MPTVADLQQLVDALEATASYTKANAHVTKLIEDADECRIQYARWTQDRLDIWTDGGPSGYGGKYGQPPDLTVRVLLPPSVAELLQIAAAERVDKAAGILDNVPKRPVTSTELGVAAEAAAVAKRWVEGAVVLEAVAGACVRKDAIVHLSSRRGSSGPYGMHTAAVCVIVPNSHHVCVQPTYSGYMTQQRYRDYCHGPSCEWNTECNTTLMLHDPACMHDGHMHGHHCPQIHPIVMVLSEVVAATLRVHHGLLLPERPALQIEQRPLRTLQVVGG